MSLKKISIQNFKSIKELKDFEFTNINILLGCNGSGKSNFISFFKLLQKIEAQEIRKYFGMSGDPVKFLHLCPKKNKNFSGHVKFADCSYSFKFQLTKNNSLVLSNESLATNDSKVSEEEIYYGTQETKIYELIKNYPATQQKQITMMLDYFRSIRIYHFNDTGDTAPFKLPCKINDNRELKEDGRNIAAFLYKIKIKYPQSFKILEAHIRLLIPYFDKFILEPDELNAQMILLKWKDKNNDTEFDITDLSDGTIRLILLFTVLLQPMQPPVFIFDEPELSLHPSAISILASMMQSASVNSQVIVSTQSVDFVNHFEPEDIIIVDRKNNESQFRRLSSKKLKDWLEDYSIGEIWEKNIVGGRP